MPPELAPYLPYLIGAVLAVLAHRWGVPVPGLPAPQPGKPVPVPVPSADPFATLPGLPGHPLANLLLRRLLGLPLTPQEEAHAAAVVAVLAPPKGPEAK